LTQPLSRVPAPEDSVEVSEHFSFEKAIFAQEQFSRLVQKQSALPKTILRVAGVDVAYVGKYSFTAAALLEYDTLKLAEVKCIKSLIRVPYRAGFLGFREAPSMIEAIQMLKTKPEVILVDGHGLAHPRRFGLACHVGVLLDLPTIGIAKNLFYGKVHGDRILEENGNELGGVINAGKKTLYVSIGHKISLETAVQIAEHCIVSNAPEPLKIAHQKATVMARKMMI